MQVTGNDSRRWKRIIDEAMTIVLLCLMAYQVTGEAAHEWSGIVMTVLVILHQILNRRWYAVLLKGKYTATRVVMTVVNVCLIIGILITAFCGMSMSVYAVPFLYGMARVSFVRQMHLTMTHWVFILMGIHLGLHIRTMLLRTTFYRNKEKLLSFIMAVPAGIGFWLFFRNNMPAYLFFKVPFAFLDYDKAAWLVFFENLLMLFFWVFIGYQVAMLLRNKAKDGKPATYFPVAWMALAAAIGLILNTAIKTENPGFGTDSWQAIEDFQGETDTSVEEPVEEAAMDEEIITENAADTDKKADAEKEAVAENAGQEMSAADVQDGYILINGGSFLMGSPETENWRIEDEAQHEATVSSFYMDTYETTQEEYLRLMGENPSSFTGESLPVESISWLDAVRFANAKSKDAHLTPAYEINGGTITWDRSANGYRLPTEAEWEYACRANTTTPFNTETSISTEEANYWGSYPYEIEENYFNTDVLDTKPGSSEGETVSVGSYPANAFGLFDMHGNVNEWCWDYYGPYESGISNDSTGAASGTRHIYRGGGWNDFAKNLRSAYRAAGPTDLKYSNLGVRLVRNAVDMEGIVSIEEKSDIPAENENVLIVYYSWGGNTRGIANEIQGQTGAFIFEITLVEPYSTDYNTVLMEAQEDQHIQARPEIKDLPDSIDEYGTILLGYPNWWASIPMPIATFLEAYDFSGKTIVPFCSHGGGRFGQSLTAIAKLAPEARMGEGLAINYSGGSSMPEDVTKWLEVNGMK